LHDHLRLKAPRKLGMSEAPGILCEWTPVQEGLPADGQSLGDVG
jgi:hypothetical protein